jgi:hypothetical protein
MTMEGRTLAGGLTLLSVIVCASPASAQVAPAAASMRSPVIQTASAMAGRLDGLVTDDRGAPLRGAAVTAQGAVVQFAVTDDRGRFAFQGLRPGPYLIRAALQGYSNSRRELVQVIPAGAAWHGFRLSRLSSAESALADARVQAAGLSGLAGEPSPADHDHSNVAWQVRHLKRSVLRDEGPMPLDTQDTDEFDAWLAGEPRQGLGSVAGPMPAVSSGWLPSVALAGQAQLLTTSSFDSAGQLFSDDQLPAGMAYYVALGAPAGSRANWAVQMAVAQGELSSWTLAGTYAMRVADRHALDVDVAYGWQRYEGGNPFALAAVATGDRSAGVLTVSDRWDLSDEISVTLGTRFSRYAYVEGPAMWSPSAAIRIAPSRGGWVRVLTSQQMTAPGAEEFVPAPVGGLWLPAQRTFSAIVPGAPFRPERTRHVEVAFDQQLGSLLVTARAYRQSVSDQMVTLFGPDESGARPRTSHGHYFVASGGNVEATGWGVALSRPTASRVRGSVEYALSNADWLSSPESVITGRLVPSTRRAQAERVHDVTTTLETDLPITATRVFALYRLSTGFARPSLAEPLPGFGARFDVQVSQRLPFLDFTAAEWEVLVAVRNLFREAVPGMSIYDELLVVHPPKRIVGGVLVKF